MGEMNQSSILAISYQFLTILLEKSFINYPVLVLPSILQSSIKQESLASKHNTMSNYDILY